MTCTHRVTATYKHKGKVVQVKCVHCGATLPIGKYGDTGRTDEPGDT